ncbi:MAG: DUF721 domain-containing protein [Chitinispirillaceae bacterium]|jgi:predicted nucleic acid-binding Zn ribbon protein|nr:DUF721 domain-containing protein [Chitinispirillaceae bacterium]
MNGQKTYTRKVPRRLDVIVDEVCSRFGINDARAQYKALHIWSEITGDTIAAISVAERLTDGRLFIRVKHSVWRMELNFRKQELVEKMNKALGQEIIKEIVFR